MTTAVTLTPAEAAAQSLASGAAGVALLHIEQALNGSDWSTAHAHLQRMMAGRIDAADHTGLFYGAPAAAFVLHAAGADGRARYRCATDTLDREVIRLTRQRLILATQRMRAGAMTAFGEYDLFYGLTGIGVLLLRHHPDTDVFADLLTYLVRLTEPRHDDGLVLPGWWVAHDPDPTLPTAGGHANFGMAHGAAGMLALLALAGGRGHVVDGQVEAVQRLCTWCEAWKQDSPDGPWWPQWVTRSELRAGRPTQAGPGRPSWCYGSAGIARALQLAALCTGDAARRAVAEEAMAACLTNRQLDRLTDAGLCHGIAGLYQTAYRAAADADSTLIHGRLALARETLARRMGIDDCGDTGLLTGVTGASLALHTARRTSPPLSGWDACLLIS